MPWRDRSGRAPPFPSRYLAQSALTSYQIVSGAAGLSFGNAERPLQTVSQQLPLAQAAGYGRGPRAVTTVTNRPKARTAGTRIGGGSTRRATGAEEATTRSVSAVRRAAQCLSSVGRHVREDAAAAAERARVPRCQPSSGPATGEEAPGGALSTVLPCSAHRSGGCAAPEAARGQSRSLQNHWLARTHARTQT